MADFHLYLGAATRANTQRSYASAIRHFEVEWGGHLPATTDSVARYLADYAEQHAINTLRQRLAALARWHIEQGFADPTRTPLVRKVLSGEAPSAARLFFEPNSTTRRNGGHPYTLASLMNVDGLEAQTSPHGKMRVLG